MSNSTPDTPQRIQWHRLLGRMLELALAPVGISVETEVQITSDPPRVDILLLRRDGDAWTSEQKALLPDGVRDSRAGFILLEFKYSESLTLDGVTQALGYDYFFRTGRRLGRKDVAAFILSSQTPRAGRLVELGYVASEVPGVYNGTNIYTERARLLVLNELRDEPHNSFIKLFASRRREKAEALQGLKQVRGLPDDLFYLVEGLQMMWSLPKGANMSEVLTPERVIEIGKEAGRLLLQNLPAEELDEMIAPSYRQGIFEQGMERGMERGMEQSKDILLNMHAQGFDIPTIADMTGLSVKQIRALLNGDDG